MRKPRRIKIDSYSFCFIDRAGVAALRQSELTTKLDLTQARRLHAWLGRYIAWREG